MINKIYCGDCIEVMKGFPDKSINMILCDLPYGTTAVACINLKRNYILIEKEQKYINIANQRIRAVPETLF